MIALDTNVVVRLVTRDDPAQAARAEAVFRSGSLWLARTVLLETEWVLRFTYGLDRDTIEHTFGKLLGYRPLEIEDRGTVLRALAWYHEGLDFADALHLAVAHRADRFVTFDRRLAAKAADLDTEPPVDAL